MAAKKTIRYRGQTIRIWDKSWRLNDEPVAFIGIAPDVRAIKRSIDERINSGQHGEPWGLTDREAASRHYQGIARQAQRQTKFRRIVDWFELQIGVGGDLHRQVWYAWRDYPDAMKLTCFVFAALGALAVLGSAWLIVRLGGFQ